MKGIPSTRTLAMCIGLVTALLLVAVAQARSSSQSRARGGTGALVALRKTALGTILSDRHGRTLYLFEKDGRSVSLCKDDCTKFWPPLTSQGKPRAGKGVHKSLLGLTRSRQVTYAGHPLYLFVGDKRPGQTAGEGLENFGAEWYALGRNGHKVERQAATPPSGGYGGGW